MPSLTPPHSHPGESGRTSNLTVQHPAAMSRRKAIAVAGPFLGAALASTPSFANAGWFFPMSNESPESTSSTEASYTPESERSVKRALTWLKKVQNNDGGCGVDVAQGSDIGCTAMVGLALMAAGTTPVEGDQRGMLRRIRKYLLRQVDNMPANDVTSVTATQLQNKIGRHAHSFFAALFLSQILGQGTDPAPIKSALKRVVSAIVRSQGANGDWGGQSWAPVLGTVMGWVSLRAADFVGLSVGGAPQKTARHLVKTMRQNIAQRGWMHQLYKNASGIRVLYEMEMENEPTARQAFQEVLTLISKDNTPFTQAGGEEFLAFHLITETMLKKGGQNWNTWFPVVRDKLIKVQNGDGSWTGHHCITSRTFCTAAASLVLTSPYRYLPISQA